jgi:predicted glycogen debranching enzyme
MGYEWGARQEWLVANGLGGYASSTAVGANTRAYHGLLVAALEPPTDRRLLLASVDEEINGISLANHQYPGAIHPQGFKHLQQFSLDPLPRFRYHAGEVEIEKTVFMIHGENTTIVRYRTNGEGRIRIAPLVHSRSFHSAAGLPAIRQEAESGGTLLRAGCRLTLLSDRARYFTQEAVYYNFEYEAERTRGLAWKEDLFCPGYFELDLSGETSFSIAASTWRSEMPSVDEFLAAELSRAESLRAPLQKFAAAADSFLVRRGQGKSIIAGYHWFDDWGRDAMISLPGLLLTTGRLADAKAVLETFASAMKEGVLPNDLGARSYNTADASLWFLHAASSYYSSSGDARTIRSLWPALMGVVRRYASASQGSDFGMAEDGLIVCAPALTWMDARVDGRPVTPRAGKCCEINALWYSGLLKLEELAGAVGASWDCETDFADLAAGVKKGYQRFWNSETGCLFDHLDPEDASIRPNQIISVLVPDLLPLTMRRSIFEVVTRELLTPFGLRTLTPRDPRYQGRYEGGPHQRDSAYHQGTVWPWLMGPYIDAFFSLNGRSSESRARAKEILRPLAEMETGGLKTVPEVFDGDRPQMAGGCISQAWSVAELLRAWQETEKEGIARRNIDQGKYNPLLLG